MKTKARKGDIAHLLIPPPPYPCAAPGDPPAKKVYFEQTWYAVVLYLSRFLWTLAGQRHSFLVSALVSCISGGGYARELYTYAFCVDDEMPRRGETSFVGFFKGRENRTMVDYAPHSTYATMRTSPFHLSPSLLLTPFRGNHVSNKSLPITSQRLFFSLTTRCFACATLAA